ncbi:DUF2125 domain-containing protein [Bartonella sp. HY406]|uniref:DUF2125 domain-containing protein n=1 Tax=Bartonella sp. HY406 TaxID=2979331 RepID=UPI0021CACA4E|nr:DUF2125 domain-containing protein [Bartonella sp. HY406]UXN03067.1 DUF2125 domain-containing protein [Bartonella sp. HY406]
MNFPDSPPKSCTRPAKKRFWRIIGSVVFAVFVLYSIAWYFLSAHVQKVIEERLAASADRGMIIYCENLHKTGFPLRIGSACDSINYQWPTAGIAISTNGFVASAPIFAPRWRLLQATSPANFEIPGLKPIGANWQRLQIDSELEHGHVSELNLRIDQLEMHNFDDNRQEIGLLKADFIRLLSNIDSAAMHIDLTYDQLILPLSISGNTIVLPAINGKMIIYLYEPQQLLQPSIGPWSNRLRSMQGNIENASLEFEGGGAFSLSGKFNFSQDGYLNGNFQIAFINTIDLSQKLRTIFPAQSSNISSFFFALNSLPKDQNGNPIVNFNVKHGEISALFFKLGHIPPV